MTKAEIDDRKADREDLLRAVQLVKDPENRLSRDGATVFFGMDIVNGNHALLGSVLLSVLEDNRDWLNSQITLRLKEEIQELDEEIKFLEEGEGS